jgi:hypothetical protein
LIILSADILSDKKGRAVLAKRPPRIDVAFRRQFPEFVEFHVPKKTTGGEGGEPPENGTETPE